VIFLTFAYGKMTPFILHPHFLYLNDYMLNYSCLERAAHSQHVHTYLLARHAIANMQTIIRSLWATAVK